MQILTKEPGCCVSPRWPTTVFHLELNFSFFSSWPPRKHQHPSCYTHLIIPVASSNVYLWLPSVCCDTFHTQDNFTLPLAVFQQKEGTFFFTFNIFPFLASKGICVCVLLSQTRGSADVYFPARD